MSVTAWRKLVSSLSNQSRVVRKFPSRRKLDCQLRRPGLRQIRGTAAPYSNWLLLNQRYQKLFRKLAKSLTNPESIRPWVKVVKKSKRKGGHEAVIVEPTLHVNQAERMLGARPRTPAILMGVRSEDFPALAEKIREIIFLVCVILRKINLENY